MNDVMGIIFASDNESKLNELTLERTTASLPFLGRYRLIDFTLSNFVNSGITQIGIVTKSNYQSLMDHIRMGRDWDLNRKNSGIAIFPPFVLNTSREVYKGKIEALHSILHFMNKSREDYVLLSNSNIAMNVDYEEVFDEHIRSGADVTMLTYRAKSSTSKRVVIKANEDGRIEDMFISDTPNNEIRSLGLNVYLIKKSLLHDLITDAHARGYIDWEKDLLMKKLNTLIVKEYKVTSYAAIIDDVKQYYKESMNLLDGEARKSLFYSAGIIYTKVKDSAPAIYKENAKVNNSLVADGCIIDGTVENSILFRGVVVEKGAVIKNSIIMENGHIKENATISFAITDKNVLVNTGRNISGHETYPVVIVKNKVV